MLCLTGVLQRHADCSVSLSVVVVVFLICKTTDLFSYIIVPSSIAFYFLQVERRGKSGNERLCTTRL